MLKPSFLIASRPVRNEWVVSYSFLVAFLFLTLTLVFGESQAQEKTSPHDNAASGIYERLCSSCHGNKGEGVSGEYEEPLTGVMTRFELKQYIEETMPEEDPDLCKGKDAEDVANHIYDHFYSLEAQNRLNPPSVLFSRLTREQHLNSVCDLVGSFVDRREERITGFGIKGVYYSSRRPKKSNQVAEKIDGEINFDFGEGSPDKIEGKEFSVTWRGSLIAEEGGKYQLIVRSANSVRLRLNTGSEYLIDARVVSGDRAEYRAPVNLLNGRAYDLDIEYSRHKEKKAFIELAWQRPNGTEEIIPARNFTPQRNKRTFVPSTSFPPDDNSYGYPRGISVSREWADAVSDCAIETAQAIVKNLDAFVKRSNDPKVYRKNAEDFCLEFAKRAFRGKLNENEQKTYVKLLFQKNPNLVEAVKQSIVMTLKSPRFLYVDYSRSKPGESQKGSTRTPTQLSTPAVLALVYWDSLPSEQLEDLQQKGLLADKSRTDVILQKMLQDRRTHIKVQNFFDHWLKLEELKGLEKNEKLHPDFSHELVEDLRASLHLQINRIVWDEKSDFRELFKTRKFYVNSRIAEFYHVELPEKLEPSGFALVDTRAERSGVITHPLLMSGFAYSNSSSPIHRGIFLATSVMGRRLNPPPDFFPPFDGEVAKTWTTREKVAYQTKPVSCQRCHSLLNNLGYALENFDEVGRFREKDNSKPVDSSGRYRTGDGKLIKFNGGEGLAEFVLSQPQVRENFVDELFQFMVKQPLAAFGENAKTRLNSAFEKSDYNIQKLLIEIGKVAAFEKINKAPSLKTPS